MFVDIFIRAFDPACTLTKCEGVVWPKWIVLPMNAATKKFLFSNQVFIRYPMTWEVKSSLYSKMSIGCICLIQSHKHRPVLIRNFKGWKTCKNLLLQVKYIFADVLLALKEFDAPVFIKIHPTKQNIKARSRSETKAFGTTRMAAKRVACTELPKASYRTLPSHCRQI